MGEQKKKLRLDELQVDSFVTSTSINPKIVQGGFSFVGCVTYDAWCLNNSALGNECDGDGGRDDTSWTANVSQENNAACMGNSVDCTALIYEWCRDQQSVPNCPSGLYICNSIGVQC